MSYYRAPETKIVVYLDFLAGASMITIRRRLKVVLLTSNAEPLHELRPVILSQHL